MTVTQEQNGVEAVRVMGTLHATNVDDHSDGAIYTCQDCRQAHQGWMPEVCWECGSDDLVWSYDYGLVGRFA